MLLPTVLSMVLVALRCVLLHLQLLPVEGLLSLVLVLKHLLVQGLLVGHALVVAGLGVAHVLGGHVHGSVVAEPAAWLGAGV